MLAYGLRKELSHYVWSSFVPRPPQCSDKTELNGGKKLKENTWEQGYIAMVMKQRIAFEVCT